LIRRCRPPTAPKTASLFFDDLLDAKVREFNPRYAEAEGALLGQFRHLHTDIYGNREFVEHLRNRGKFFDHEEKRERDLILIDYADDPARNVYEVTEEWAFHNGHYGTREDVVFLINGIPVLVIECKNANKDEAIALGVDQIRRYHRETPELFVSQQLFTATDAIGFSYGVTGTRCGGTSSTGRTRRVGKLEAKVKSFCAIPQVLAFLKDYIVFAEKDEELNKYILRQHQTGAVEATVSRALDPKRTRGLVWHTQGSGKTFTMIKAAERLFRAPEADKPTVLLMIDRNELEDQMLKNLAALGLGNLEHASSIARLNQLLRDDYRGIIVTMIHKFRDMPADLNTALEHLRPHRRSPPHHRRRSRQLPHGRPAERDLPRLHRHAGGQDRLRQGHLQDLRLRGRPGLPAQVFHRRQHRGRHHAAALLPARAPTKCSCRTRRWTRSSSPSPKPRAWPTSRS
jgi:type I restriction enzyme, R subunit